MLRDSWQRGHQCLQTRRFGPAWRHHESARHLLPVAIAQRQQFRHQLRHHGLVQFLAQAVLSRTSASATRAGASQLKRGNHNQRDAGLVLGQGCNSGLIQPCS
jgi:hypothetical protein